MSLYDLERGCKKIDGNRFYSRFISPIAASIDKKKFTEMVHIVDSRICVLRPSELSQLVWTRCSGLIGYMAPNPDKTKMVWDAAFVAVKGHPDECNKFVGGLIMWRISLIESDTWLTSKTKDLNGVYPWRSYWINNDFVLYDKKHAITDLAAKFNGSRV